MKEEWRFALFPSGVESVPTIGIIMMPQLFVGSLVTHHTVAM